MAQTRTYATLLSLVESLSGSDDLSAAEQVRIKAFANRRARKAYHECDYWPNFLVSGQERVISSAGVLPYAESGLDSIDVLLRLNESDPYGTTQAPEYQEWHADSGGIVVTGYVQKNHSNDDGTYAIWATYKKRLTTTYGDGNGETADVPDEWWEYMAQGAYADWLRSEGQTEKAVVEDAIAEQVLAQQLEKVSSQVGAHRVTRVNNHNTRQLR